MYYSRLLKHANPGCSILKESKVNESPYLRKIVPDYFDCTTGDGNVHALIICSDGKDAAWTNQEFQAKFVAAGSHLPEILTDDWSRDRRAKRLCVHIDNDLSTIPKAVEEVAKAILTCYDNHAGKNLKLFANCFTERAENNVIDSCHQALMEEIADATQIIGCPRTLFIRIIMPQSCFDAFKNRYFPPFVEYVVLGHIDDPRIFSLQSKLKEATEQKLETEKLLDEAKKEYRLLQGKLTEEMVPLADHVAKCAEYEKIIDYLSSEIYRLKKELETERDYRYNNENWRRRINQRK